MIRAVLDDQQTVRIENSYEAFRYNIVMIVNTSRMNTNMAKLFEQNSPLIDWEFSIH